MLITVVQEKKFNQYICQRTFNSKILEHAELEDDIYRFLSPGYI